MPLFVSSDWQYCMCCAMNQKEFFSKLVPHLKKFLTRQENDVYCKQAITSKSDCNTSKLKLALCACELFDSIFFLFSNKIMHSQWNLKTFIPGYDFV